MRIYVSSLLHPNDRNTGTCWGPRPGTRIVYACAPRTSSWAFTCRASGTPQSAHGIRHTAIGESKCDTEEATSFQPKQRQRQSKRQSKQRILRLRFATPRTKSSSWGPRFPALKRARMKHRILRHAQDGAVDPPPLRMLGVGGPSSVTCGAQELSRGTV